MLRLTRNYIAIDLLTTVVIKEYVHWYIIYKLIHLFESKINSKQSSIDELVSHLHN